MPIDIEKFDNNVRQWMLVDIVTSYLDYLLSSLSSESWLYLFLIGFKQNIIYGIENTRLCYNRWSASVEDGLMSGWKTTSIFGSIVNIILFRCACKHSMIEPKFYLALGDDLDVSFDRMIKY